MNKKGSLPAVLAAIMLGAMSGPNVLNISRENDIDYNDLEARSRKRAKQKNICRTSEKQLHKFKINGEVIEAVDKKTAKKIHARRNKNSHK